MVSAELPVVLPSTSSVAPWNLWTRIGFRFAFLYFGLCCLTTQTLGGLISIPDVDIPDITTYWPLKPMIFWVAAHVFGARLPLVYQGSGSGDKTFDWVLIFCLLAISVVGTVVWSLIDRRRSDYRSMFKWFRLFIRFSLGAQMLGYGFVKLVPLQMPYPGPRRELEPFGSFSPMGVLWTFIGASPAYEMLCGGAEVVAGLLVMVPRTALLGSLACAGVTAQIFILNMTYDVPVKLFSFHLLLMSLLLAAPEMGRMADFFLRDRDVARSVQPSLLRPEGRAGRIVFAAQIVFLVWLAGTDIYGARKAWTEYGEGRPKSPLYGIWTIDRVWIDGHERSPLLNDYGRWRRMIFTSPDSINYQRMDDSFGYFGSEADAKTQTLQLTDGDKKSKGSLHYQRPAPNALMLEGNVDGHAMRMQMTLMPEAAMPLRSRGFHWVQEYPFNR